MSCRSAIAWALVLAVVTSGTLSCFGVRARRSAPPPSGFLGDYSQLEARSDTSAHLTYFAPGVDWSRYRSIQIDSVSLWVTERPRGLSDEQLQKLADVAYGSLHDELGKHFVLVEHPRGDTLRVRAALTQARGANVPLRILSTYVPAGLVLSTAVGVTADVAQNVGTVAMEVEVVDPVTDRRLAAAVDSRAGTKNPFTQRTFSTWADVDAAFDWWSQRLADFFLRVGVSPK